jgi:hypothetical protein
MKKLFLLLVLLSFVTSCGSEDGGGDPGNLSIVFTSSTLSTRSAVRAGSGCTVSTDAGGVELGLCYTPLQISGYFNRAQFTSTGGGTPVRILGGGTDTGIAAAFKKTAFDLKTAPTIASSEDNIEDGGGTYNLASIQMQALEVAFTAESGNRIYRVRIPFVTTPPSSSSVYSSCGLGGGLADADTAGTLFGSVVALPGDILVCIKSSASETCADTDYQWIVGSGLVPTRTGSVRTLTGTYLSTAESCTAAADHSEIDWGYLNFDLTLGTPVTVSAASSGGTKTYTSGGTSGTKLTVNLDVASTGSLFVPTSALGVDLSAATEGQILAAMESILLKPVYVKKRKNSASSDSGDMAATVTLTVSN